MYANYCIIRIDAYRELPVCRKNVRLNYQEAIMEKNQGFATKQIHVGKVEIPGIAPLATPIFQTSTFEFETTSEGARRFAGEEQGYICLLYTSPSPRDS